MKQKQTLIKFNQTHIGVAIKWQIEVIAELASIVDSLPSETIDRLSVVLCILHRCYEVAPKGENNG